MAWLLTIMGRPFLRLGGTGDLRAFQTAFRASLMLAACAALLILTTPFLADYAVMNVALFLILFTLGFLTARILGINFWIQLAYITISAFVGLNPRRAGSVADDDRYFSWHNFGMFIGTVLSKIACGRIATKSPARIIHSRFLPRSKRCSMEIPIERRFRRNWTCYHCRGPTGCSSDSNSRMFAGRKGEACRSGSRATNVNNSDQPFTFSPRHVAGNHRTNTEAAI